MFVPPYIYPREGCVFSVGRVGNLLMAIIPVVGCPDFGGRSTPAIRNTPARQTVGVLFIDLLSVVGYIVLALDS